MLIRGHHELDGKFTQIPNEWLRDKNLTLAAIGLLAQLLSHSPGWSVSLESLAKHNGCGRDHIRTCVRQLEAGGYLKRSKSQRQSVKGYFTGYDYWLGSPSLENPTKDEPTKDEPTKENPAHKKTIDQKTIEKNTIEIDSQFEEFWKVYPKRADKPLARRSFEKALERADFQTIMDGAIRHRDDPNREDQFTKNPSTWLRADAWNNPMLPGSKKAATKRLIDEWRTGDAAL
jgi:hypothetical protein